MDGEQHIFFLVTTNTPSDCISLIRINKGFQFVERAPCKLVICFNLIINVNTAMTILIEWIWGSFGYRHIFKTRIILDPVRYNCLCVAVEQSFTLRIIKWLNKTWISSMWRFIIKFIAHTRIDFLKKKKKKTLMWVYKTCVLCHFKYNTISDDKKKEAWLNSQKWWSSSRNANNIQLHYSIASIFYALFQCALLTYIHAATIKKNLLKWIIMYFNVGSKLYGYYN